MKKLPNKLPVSEKKKKLKILSYSKLPLRNAHDSLLSLLEYNNITNNIENTGKHKLLNERNLSKEEKDALTELTIDPNIVIQEANKII